MGHLVTKDSEGVEHFVWLQEKGDTCGPACIYMLETQKEQASIMGGEDRITYITSMLPKGYSEGKGTQSYTALKAVMDSINMPAAAMVTNISNFVSLGYFPFIARVGWSNGGGHFVVGQRVTKSKFLVCLDPWYGLVEVSLASLPTYSVQSNARTGENNTPVATGQLSGHVIYQNATGI